MENSNTSTTKYRMVAFDLDGTLLAPNHKISDYAVQYLRSLHARGFIVSIATGRSPAAIAEVIRRLNFEFPKPHSKSFPVVSTNGAKGLHVSHEVFDDEGVGVGCLINAEEYDDADGTCDGSIPGDGSKIPAELLRVLRRLSDGGAELIEPFGVTSLFEALDSVNWNEDSLKVQTDASYSTPCKGGAKC